MAGVVDPNMIALSAMNKVMTAVFLLKKIAALDLTYSFSGSVKALRFRVAIV